MLCHECLMVGREQPAVALCKFCSVALCKPHLVELYRNPATVPQYTCRHFPGEPALSTRPVEIGAARNGKTLVGSAR